MTRKLPSAALLTLLLVMPLEAAQGQARSTTGASGASESLRPASASAAVRLIIPLGGGEMRSRSRLAFTAGPEWRGEGAISLPRPRTFSAGVTFDGNPVLTLGGLDFFDGTDWRLSAGATDDNKAHGVVLGVAALGVLIALFALAPAGERSESNIGSVAADALYEGLAEKCPNGWLFVPCVPQPEE